MTIQEYISSGIVQTCVLDLASTEERVEFDRMCAIHPEVRQAREAFEISLEKNMLENAVQPPASLKSKIIAEIEIERERRKENGIAPLPRIPSTANNLSMGWLRYAAVAAVLLLVASTGLNFYFFSQYREYITKYDQLLANQNQLASTNRVLLTKMQDYETAINMMKDPAMAVVKMPGTSPHLGSLATVYWDTRSKDVWLLVNNLPPTATEKQYQLWAIVDGKPVDAGMIDIREGLTFVKMKNIPKAEAFAITLEKKGGSLSPTLDAMFVLGKVAG